MGANVRFDLAELLVHRCGHVVATALVDAADALRLRRHRWTLSSKGYVVRYEKRDGKTVCFALHREVLGLVPGDGKMGDHENGNKLDNRRSNLRVANAGQNARNRRGRGGRQKNVYRRRDGRYEVRVCLGSFDTEEQANAVARNWLAANQPDSREARATA